MIWKDTKRQKWKFHPEPIEELRWNQPNPARGWYAVYTFGAEQKINPAELKWSLREGETVSLVLLDIGVFRDGPLDKQALDNIREILLFFKKYQRDVIFRPVYDREGNGLLHEPDIFETVLIHLRQLGKLLVTAEHSVFVWQGLLVGSWGEMHTSKYLSEEHLTQLWNCLQPYLRDDIYLAVRTPAQWRTLVEEECQKENFGQIGIFDDGIFGSASHLGTFGTMTREAAGWKSAWNRKEELDFLEEITVSSPCGGEAVDRETVGVEEETELTVQGVLNEMRKMHLVYLNSVYDSSILKRWKKQYLKSGSLWDGCSLYEYVGAHLGYRFTVKNIEAQFQHFHKVKFRIMIENSGFGNFFQNAELFLVMRGETAVKEFLVPFDIREWKSGTTAIVEATTERMEAAIYLRLRRKKDGYPVYFTGQKDTDSLYLGRLYLKNAQ